MASTTRSPSRAHWEDMGPVARAALAAGASSGLLAFISMFVWCVVATRMEATDKLGYCWHYYGKPRSESLSDYRPYFEALDISRGLIFLCLAVGVASTVAGLLNANRQSPPPFGRHAIFAGLGGIVASIVSLLLTRAP